MCISYTITHIQLYFYAFFIILDFLKFLLRVRYNHVGLCELLKCEDRGLVCAKGIMHISAHVGAIVCMPTFGELNSCELGFFRS